MMTAGDNVEAVAPREETRKAHRGDRPESDRIETGTPVGDYVVQELLGHGGFGDVYMAIHSVLGRKVALKVLHPSLAHSREVLERFESEARAANLIRHPNIVDVIGFGEMPDGR